MTILNKGAKEIRERIFICLRRELTGDPIWGEDIEELNDEAIVEVAAEDWLGVIEGAEVTVERLPVEEA